MGEVLDTLVRLKLNSFLRGQSGFVKRLRHIDGLRNSGFIPPDEPARLPTKNRNRYVCGPTGSNAPRYCGQPPMSF